MARRLHRDRFGFTKESTPVNRDGRAGPVPMINVAVARLTAHVRRPGGPAVGHPDCGRPCPRESIGATQCIGQPAPSGHAPDQLRGVDCGHPGCTDEQRASRGSVKDRHRVGGRAQPGLGDPDHWNAEIGVRMRSPAGPTTGVQVGVAVGHQQAQPGQTVQDHAQRWGLTQVELSRPVGRYLGPPRCVRPAGARTRHQRPGRLPPGRRRSSSNTCLRRRPRQSPGAHRSPGLEGCPNQRQASGPRPGSRPHGPAASCPGHGT